MLIFSLVLVYIITKVPKYYTAHMTSKHHGLHVQQLHVKYQLKHDHHALSAHHIKLLLTPTSPMFLLALSAYQKGQIYPSCKLKPSPAPQCIIQLQLASQGVIK